MVNRSAVVVDGHADIVIDLLKQRRGDTRTVDWKQSSIGQVRVWVKTHEVCNLGERDAREADIEVFGCLSLELPKLGRVGPRTFNDFLQMVKVEVVSMHHVEDCGFYAFC